MFCNKKNTLANRRRSELIKQKTYGVTGWGSNEIFDTLDNFTNQFFDCSTPMNKMKINKASRSQLVKIHKQNEPPKRRTRLLKKLRQNKSVDKPHTSRHSSSICLDQKQIIHTQIIGLKDIKVVFDPRHHTQRNANKKQYPKNIYQFTEFKRQLQYIKNNSLQKRFSMFPDQNKSIKACQRFKPYLPSSKIIKLQGIRRSPLKVKQNFKLNCVSEMKQFDDQRIFTSIHQYQNN